MTTLHLGVTDIPYSWGQKQAGGISSAKAMHAAKKGTGSGGGTSTGDVAEILQKKYGLFTAFMDIHQKVIEWEIENSLRGAFETAIIRKIPGGMLNAYATATSGIEELFKDALTMQTYDHRIKGVPTGAALAGIRHSFKNPRQGAAKGPRPSFIDTGLFRASFRAWVT